MLKQKEQLQLDYLQCYTQNEIIDTIIDTFAFCLSVH